MKSVGGIFDAIIDWENLELAATKAMRGKRDRPAVIAFSRNAAHELTQIREQLAEGVFPFGKFTNFEIHDPKRRLISAPSFRERIVHHAIMNVCEPIFESFLIFDSYACRVGKGQFAALHRAVKFSKKYRWLVKADIRKCFESIPKARLEERLNRRFREAKMRQLFSSIITSFEPGSERGLPIGALTSQHFANFYLGHIDHEAKQRCQARGYIRYMDDFVAWGESREIVERIGCQLSDFAGRELGIEVKPPVINRSVVGFDFLGHRVFPNGLRLNRRSRRRFRKQYKQLQLWHERGLIDDRQYQDRVVALVAFTEHCACRSWRRKVIFPTADLPKTAPTA